MQSSKQNFLSSHALIIVWYHFVDEHFASATEQYHYETVHHVMHPAMAI